MFLISKKLKAKLEELLSLRKRIEEQLAKAPFGELQIITCHGYPQFYRKLDRNTQRKGANKRRREYISTKETETIQRLVQKDYNVQLLDMVTNQIDALENFLRSYDETSIWNLQKTYPAKVQKYISPIFDTDEVFIQKWLELWPLKPNTYPFKSDIITLKGEQVRSKTEKIIADTLNAKGIPYKYECGIHLNRCNKNKYPDFTCLKVRERRQIYWEHLGMIENTSYAVKNLERIFEYQMEGFVIGRDYILTYETYDHPLETRMIEMIIQEFLL